MKRFGRIAFIFAGVFFFLPQVLAANGQAEDEAEDEVTVRMWFGREEFVPDDNFETFHEENPNIRVEAEVTPLEDTAVDLIRNHDVGTDPDIAQTFMTYTTSLADQGVLQDMTPYFEQWQEENPEQYENIAEVGWESAKSDGVPYGMSAHATAIWHVWRVDWLEEAGVESIPETWEEVIDAAIQIRDSGILDSGQYPYAVSGSSALSTQISFNAYFMAMGGQFTDSGIPIIDSETGRFMVDFYQTLSEEDLINPDALAWNFGEVRGSFTGDDAGMFVMGANVFPAFLDAGLEYGEDANWVATEQPRRQGAEEDFRQFGNAFPYLVSSNTEHPEAVLKVLQYLNREEIVGEVAARYQPATNVAVSEDPDLREEQPWLEPLFESWLNLTAHPTHRQQAQINDTMVQMIQEAIDEPELDPSDITRRAQEELDELE